MNKTNVIMIALIMLIIGATGGYLYAKSTMHDDMMMDGDHMKMMMDKSQMMGEDHKM